MSGESEDYDPNEARDELGHLDGEFDLKKLHPDLEWSAAEIRRQKTASKSTTNQLSKRYCIKLMMDRRPNRLSQVQEQHIDMLT